VIIKVVRGKDPFTRIPNAAINDKQLSFRALGVLTYFASKPHDWTVRVEDLMARDKEGRDALRASMKELRDAGYAQLRAATDIGRFWVVSTDPESLKTRLSGKPENPSPENPSDWKPVDIQKKDLVQTKEVTKIPESLNNPQFLESFTEFQAYRKEKKLPLGPVAAKRLLNTLNQRPSEAVKALGIAIDRNWRGFSWDWIDNQTNGQTPKRPVENAI
jgi:hypothetical protein